MISLNKGSLLNQIIFGLTDKIDNRNKPTSKARFQKKIVEFSFKGGGGQDGSIFH